MLIFHHQLSLAEGFEVLEKTKHDRLIRGKQVSACSGWALFQTYKGKPIRCWSCGCKADRWIADQGRRNPSPPVVNLYGIKDGKLLMMNRDHIIPKSLGGLDMNENLRPACEECNGNRGNELNAEDLQFRKDHPEFISQARLNHGKENARRAWKAQRDNPEEQARIEAVFTLIGEPLW